MKLKNKWLWISLSVVLLVVGLWFQFGKRKTAERFAAVLPERTDLSIKIQATGTVVSENRLEIKPPTAGRLEDVLVEEGVQVKKGQILGWMSSSERVSLLDAARAKGPQELERWQEMYRATPVIAPLSGTLIASNVKPGQTVIGTDVIFVVSDHLIIQATVDETDIAQVKLKQDAEVTLDAYPKSPLGAHVIHIAYDAKTVNNVTTYQVGLFPKETPPFMKSGMTAGVAFTVEERENALTIPVEAVSHKDGKSFVSVKGEGREPAEKEIEVGLSDGKRIEIVSGIGETDSVLVPQISLPSESAKAVNPFMPSFGRKGGRAGASSGRK